MKIDSCLMLVLGSAVSLAACTREQDSAARSPQSTPMSGMPEDDKTGTGWPNDAPEDSQRPQTLDPEDTTYQEGPEAPSNPPGPGGPTSSIQR
jgi:hypothetical protein